MNFDYEHVYQVIGGLYSIPIVGFICTKFKVFELEDLWPLFEVSELCFYPGLVFLMLGQSKMTMETWKPFFPIALTQLFFHLVALLVAFVTKRDDFVLSYLKSVTTIGFQEYTVFAAQFLLVIAGKNYQYISALYLITENFIYLPILKLIIYFYNKSDLSNEDIEIPNEVNQTDKTLEEEEGKEEAKVKCDEAGNPLEAFDPEEEDAVSKVEDENEISEIVPEQTLAMTAIKAWINPTTVMIIVGLIWSATKADIPDLIVNFSSYLTKCVVGVSLFVTGGLCTFIDFKIFNIWLPLSLVGRYVVGPLIMGGLAKAMKIPTETRKLLVLMACAPISMISAKAMNNSDKMGIPLSAFFWSIVLYLPAALIWGAILIETDLF